MACREPAIYEATRSRVPDGCPLTNTEYDLLVCLSQGMVPKQAAWQRRQNWSTVRTHLSNAYARLGVQTAYQAITIGFEEGWLGRPRHERG